MATGTVRLVTIVAEALLSEKLIAEARKAGARGYTLTEASGEGPRGLRSTELGARNVRLEFLMSESAAALLLERLAESYFAHYAVVAWVADVGVVRAEKYV